MILENSPEIIQYAALVFASIGVGFLAGRKVSSVPKRFSTGTRLRDQAKPLEAGDMDECKMALVVRTDLRMSTGKIAAQCSHATLSCYQTLEKTNPMLLRQWERAGQAKVALKCSSEAELLELQSQATRLSLCARSIRDAGRTQIAAGSRTVLGIIGPGRLVNQVTGKLRLL